MCPMSINTIPKLWNVTFMLIFIYLICYNKGSVVCEFVTVSVKQGFLSGITMFSRNGAEYHSFLGVPYAKPPLDDLRFEPPQEASPWFGIKNAFFPAPLCIQNNVLEVNDNEVKEHGSSSSSIKVIGQEDCLYLNIHTPSIDQDANLPVLVWIHGGAFYVGSANMYDPNYILDHQIVVVIVNYRLGSLGYLSMCDTELPGNYGMKDQVMALKWIRENIYSFGGDCDKITLAGQSSGGASVDYHMRSISSKGLFHRAISHSGTALSFWSQTPCEAARDRARTLGVLCGCRLSSTSSLVECLKSIPASELIDKQTRIRVWNDDPLVLYGVVTEPEEVDGAFITKDPWKQTEIISPVPWIVGFTSGEGGFRVAKFLSNDAHLVDELDSNSDRYFPLIFDLNYRLNSTETSTVSKLIRKRYFDKEKIEISTSTNMVNAITDGFFAYNIMESALHYPGQVFMYYYDHQNQHSFNELVKNCCQENLGVGHGDDLLSFFSFPFIIPDISSEIDMKVSEQLISTWIHFADTGYPGSEWHQFESPEFQHLHITSYGNIMKNMSELEERYKFWKNLNILLFDKNKDDTHRTFNHSEL